jgi:hypothetical protein
MVVTLWVPGKDGTPHQRHALIENVRRIRASAEVYAGFDLEILGIGRFDYYFGRIMATNYACFTVKPNRMAGAFSLN